jgi:DNA-binding NarL/FixJ family response regulator
MSLERDFTMEARQEQVPEPHREIDLGNFTANELDMWGLLACGKTNLQIAECLGITGTDVNKALGSLYEKLGTNDRVAASRLAVGEGLLDLALQSEENTLQATKSALLAMDSMVETVAPANEILTSRELEILSLLKSGLSPQEIAQQSNRSEEGIVVAIIKIYSKLGVSTRIQAINSVTFTEKGEMLVTVRAKPSTSSAQEHNNDPWILRGEIRRILDFMERAGQLNPSQFIGREPRIPYRDKEALRQLYMLDFISERMAVQREIDLVGLLAAMLMKLEETKKIIMENPQLARKIIKEESGNYSDKVLSRE